MCERLYRVKPGRREPSLPLSGCHSQEANGTVIGPQRSFQGVVRPDLVPTCCPRWKLRIVLEGFRREGTVNESCCREGIKPHSY